MKYRMEDGTIINPEKAVLMWDEDTYFDGRNTCSKATGSQWTHERLYKSRKGRYYILHWSQWQGSRDHCEWVSEHEATRWLLANEHNLPPDLAHLAEEIEE